MNKFIIYSAGSIISLFLLSCGTSTGSRYERSSEKKKTSASSGDSIRVENKFDMAPYRAIINLPDPEKKDTLPEPDIWYAYENNEPGADTTSAQTSAGKKDGYRVQVYSTDDLDEANNLRSELIFKINQKNVYVIFDPPFYKVRVGDFLNNSDANQMNFKLNQMGYTESRVIKDSVNVYQ
jgi:cell division protein FtsN